jgi:hypothetical protein
MKVRVERQERGPFKTLKRYVKSVSSGNQDLTLSLKKLKNPIKNSIRSKTPSDHQGATTGQHGSGDSLLLRIRLKHKEYENQNCV